MADSVSVLITNPREAPEPRIQKSLFRWYSLAGLMIVASLGLALAVGGGWSLLTIRMLALCSALAFVAGQTVRRLGKLSNDPGRATLSVSLSERDATAILDFDAAPRNSFARAVLALGIRSKSRFDIVFDTAKGTVSWELGGLPLYQMGGGFLSNVDSVELVLIDDFVRECIFRHPSVAVCCEVADFRSRLLEYVEGRLEAPVFSKGNAALVGV